MTGTEESTEKSLRHWKRDVAGVFIALMGPAAVMTMEWEEMWSLEHFTAAAVGLFFIVAGIGVFRGWGFRD